jgi:signal transduction histidine kinase
MFSDLGDSLYKAELRNSISNMIIKYEIAKTESEKQLLKSENELIEKEKDYQIALRNFFIALSILVIIMGSVLVYFYLFRVKTSKRIEEQKIELEKLNEQLNIQNAQLIELNKHKDRMFSIIAHDLRSPFHALLAFSEILRSDIKTLSHAEIEQFAENIHESSQRILTLVQNLLDWARSQLDNITINPVEFELTELISSSLEVYKKIAITKEIEITNKTEGAIKVSADKDMINSVLRNLLSNAIKFTEPKGSVEVSASINDSEIIVCVSDTGVGITESNLNFLFDPAFHISTLGTKKETGTGLGLNLCKEFTEKNGGRIWAESKPGEGSKFFVAIPRA